MKKITALLLVVAMFVLLAACTSDDNNSSTAESSVASSAAESSVASSEAESSVASSEVESSVESSEESSEAETSAMTYEEYAAADLQSEVVVETYVQAHQSWWEDKITVYCQSPDGAYFLYELACTEEDAAKLVPGTKIRVTGFKGEWEGEVEIMDGKFEFVEGGDTFIAEATDVTALLGTDDLIKNQNKFVSFKGMTVEASKDKDGNDVAFLYNWDGSGEQGNDLYFNVSVNGATYNFCVESYLCGKDTDVYKAVEALKIGDVVDMEGFLYWYQGANPHITSIKVAE